MDLKNLYAGNLVSFVASLVILSELILLERLGLSFISSPLSLAILWAIWAMAIPSVLSYHRARLEKNWMLDAFGALAVAIAGVGLAILSLGKMYGVELILLGYAFEPVAGIPIYLTAKKLLPLYTSLFFWGAVAFTAGLPLYLVNLGILAIAGDVVKIAGLVGLLARLRGVNAKEGKAQLRS
ncbi:MAG: hypothetical protein TQ35_0009335 [Candidatus Aramenus sulfurataquae]|jgi:hypothetical protein|uniref:Uncharacterized protein n=2 Tax=Candidatus Aramenus sulfurataquae TaxID=1326980 RepID=A0A0F2LMX4_9CREN|nr:hypothetical protein [Candidatus Aramenus sulfurataquae]